MLYKAYTTVYGIQIVLHLKSAVQITSVDNPGVKLKRLHRASGEDSRAGQVLLKCLYGVHVSFRIQSLRRFKLFPLRLTAVCGITPTHLTLLNAALAWQPPYIRVPRNMSS